MNNEPVAWLVQYSDFHEFKWDKPMDLQGVVACEPLYTHPVKELNDGGEPVKNATYWKRQYNLMATQNDNLKSGLYHANEQIKYLESYSVELTDEEIKDVYFNTFNWNFSESVSSPFLDFARAILRKASEK